MRSSSELPATEQQPAQAGTLGLGLLFGAIYFVQGVGEPTEGLIAQPVRALLKGWGKTDAAIAGFVAVLALPWSLKPLFGLLTDFVPILGSRRKSYLVLSSLATVAGLSAAYALPLSPGDTLPLLACLIVPTAAVALADVASDALMIEVGQPRGLTGLLQSVQWACIYLATIVTGLLGGYLSHRGIPRVGFLICAGLAVAMLGLALTSIHETPTVGRSRRGAFRALVRVGRERGLWGVGVFLFLFNFNPFSDTVLYLYMTRALKLGEPSYGRSVALLACGCMAASVAYGFYCRRIPFGRLVHASVALGIAATLAYFGLVDRRSAAVIAPVVGITYMTATLIQLDLAARLCPPEIAGTAFAVLMALENLATSLSTGIGGYLYQWGTARWGSDVAFRALVVLGAGTTAACWLVVPWLPQPSGDGKHENPGPLD